VGESVDKALAAKAFPARHLDKVEAVIIDHAACSQRLDSGALQNHLRDLGFSAVLDGLLRGPAAAKEPFRRPGLAQAGEGLLHVMGVLRERDEVREEFDQSTRRMQHAPEYFWVLPERREDGAAAFGADRTSDSRKSTEDPDRDVPSEPTTGGLANA